MTEKGMEDVLGLIRGRAEMTGRRLTGYAEDLYMETLRPFEDEFAVHVVRTALEAPGMPDDEILRATARSLRPPKMNQYVDPGLKPGQAAQAMIDGFKAYWDRAYPGQPYPDFISKGILQQPPRVDLPPILDGALDANLRRQIEAEVRAKNPAPVEPPSFNKLKTIKETEIVNSTSPVYEDYDDPFGDE